MFGIGLLALPMCVACAFARREQVEINPLGEREDGSLVNMDAKFSFDNNAVYRQPRVAALAAQSRKLDVEAAGEHSLLALETSADAHGLNYIGLPDGTIGCMVNGAGLAMATLDLLSLHRGRAANFLDLGGKASQTDVEFALQTLTCMLILPPCFIHVDFLGAYVLCGVSITIWGIRYRISPNPPTNVFSTSRPLRRFQSLIKFPL